MSNVVVVGAQWGSRLMRSYILLSAFVLLFGGIQSATARDSPPHAQQSEKSDSVKIDFAKDSVVGQWVTYYYIHKDILHIPDFLEWMQKNQNFKESTITPFASFVAVIFLENPSHVESWLKKRSFSGAAKECIERALWLSGNSHLIKPLFHDSPTYVAEKAIPLLKMPLKKTSDLDAMWGAFMASGDVAYVKRIIDVLDEKNSLSGERNRDLVMRKAAEWSLSSNVLQHAPIERLVRKEITVRPDAVKKKLQALIDEINKTIKPFPNKDGEFSAMLALVKENELREFDKPADQGVNLNDVSTAKRGDKIALKVVFSGFELSDHLDADVTYDLKILSPNHKIYDNLDSKGFVALRGKIPTRFGVFDNQSFIMIQFEPKDELGKYQIIGKLYDNVGKKKIKLQRELELIK
jgi:hypothetical protein